MTMMMMTVKRMMMMMMKSCPGVTTLMITGERETRVESAENVT